MNKQILYFYNPNCGHCKAFDMNSKDFFRNYIYTNKDIKLIKFSYSYIDNTYLDINQNKVDLDEEIIDKLKGTPTFLFVSNGKLHANLTVIGNDLNAFTKSFNIFMKVNENIESKPTIKPEGICDRVHKVETTTETVKPTCGVNKSEPVKTTTCGVNKSEPVKTTTCGVNKSDYEGRNYKFNEDKSINICGKQKTDQ